MTDPSDLAIALGALMAALDALSIPWAVGGSLASAVYGEPRATNDVDVIAALNEETARALVARLATGYYADLEMALDAVRRRSSFNVIENRTLVKVDVFVPPRGPLGLGQLDRRVVLDVLPGLSPFPVLGPEDVVLQKLRWFREGGEVSDRQWRDILGVMRAEGRRMDARYLADVALATDLSALLARARAESEK